MTQGITASFLCLCLLTQAPETSLTPKVFLGEQATFTVPPLPSRVPADYLRSVRLEGVTLGYSTNYGVENLLPTPVTDSVWTRYMAAKLHFPGAASPLTQPSFMASSSTGPLAAFDGTNEALLFNPHDGADAVVPAGPSGYWGGTAPVPAAGEQVITTLDLDLAYLSSGSWYDSVTLVLEPWGYWFGAGGHQFAWVDEMHVQIKTIDAIVYGLDRNGDGSVDYELRISM